jgi:hypothetical protein
LASDRPTGRFNRYSYSGSDIRAYAYYPGMGEELCLLESMATISISVHEAKGQARSLGYRGVKGFSRGIRTVAGTIIMTVVEDHPMRQLVSTVDKFIAREPTYWGGWSLDRSLTGTGTASNMFDFHNRLSTLLPPINIKLVFVSEAAQFSFQSGEATTSDIRYADGPITTIPNGNEFPLGTYERYQIPGASLLLEEVDFVSESFVASHNDVVTEMTFQFVAKDFKPIAPITLLQETIEKRDLEQDKQQSLFKRLFGRKTDDEKAIGQFNAAANQDRKELIQAGREQGYSDAEINYILASVGFDPLDM